MQRLLGTRMAHRRSSAQLCAAFSSSSSTARWAERSFHTVPKRSGIPTEGSAFRHSIRKKGGCHHVPSKLSISKSNKQAMLIHAESSLLTIDLIQEYGSPTLNSARNIWILHVHAPIPVFHKGQSNDSSSTERIGKGTSLQVLTSHICKVSACGPYLL